MRTPFILFLAASLFISCKDVEAESVSNSAMMVSELKSPAKAAAYEAAAVDSAASPVNPSQSETKIIKTADLSFQTSDLSTSYENLIQTLRNTKR